MLAERTPVGRLCGRLLLILWLFVACPAFADGLIVTQTSGEAKIRFDDLWQTPRAGMLVGLPAVVSTGENGSVVLEQDGSVISVATRTAIELHADAVTGEVVQRVVQDKGSAFYDIAPQGSRRFRVESPYLVAVVKGTQFNVTVTPDMATVSLFEGHLQIDAPGVGDSVEIYTGEIARRHRDDDRITIVDMADGEVASRDDMPTPVPTEDSAETGGGSDEDPGTRGVASNDDSADDDSIPAGNSPAVSGDDRPRRSGTPGGSLVAGDSLNDGDADATAGVSLGKTGAILEAGIDSGDEVLAARIDAGLTAGGTGADVGVDAGLDGDSADVGVDASVTAGDLSADAGVQVGADLGDGSVDAGAGMGIDAGGVGADADVDAGVDLADGTVDASADAGIDAGVVSADAGVDAGVDLDDGTVDAGADVGVDAGDVTADAGVDAGVDLDDGTVDTGTDVDLDTGDVTADAGVDVGADVDDGSIDVGTDVDLDAGDVTADAGVDLDDDGVSIDAGAGTTDTSVSAGADVDGDGGVNVNVGVGDVDLDLGLDLGLGGEDTDLADTGSEEDIQDSDETTDTTETDTDDGGLPGLGDLLGL